MMTYEAIKLFKDYLHSNHRKRTIESYGPLLEKFEAAYAQEGLDSIGSDEIYHFLETVTKHLSKSTRRLRYAQMKAFPF
jgi:site-specific recombinase XerD